MERMIHAVIRHPKKQDVLEVTIPASTKISQLQGIVTDHHYAKPYVMGFKFLISNHLLTDGATLENYLPENEDSVVIDIFAIPETTI